MSWIPARDVRNVQNSSGAHPDSSSIGTGGILPRKKMREREPDYPILSTVELKNEWLYTSIFPSNFMTAKGTSSLFNYRTFLKLPVRGLV